MRVVLKQPGALARNLNNFIPSEKNLQKVLGGSYSVIPLSEYIFLAVNENGSLLRLPLNFYCPEVKGYVLGAALALAFTPEGRFRSLTVEEADYVKIYLAQCV